MPDEAPKYLDHVHEVVSVVLSKIDKLPTADRSLVVIASIEAISWIAAKDVASHIRMKGYGSEEAEERCKTYVDLFELNLRRALPENYGRRG
ncbi:MAG: hypothetical protein JKY60_09210 [Kordiimonadaceae bacterium]|nr:hypothetical protein [Kordiimonadaceae bacterium]